MPRAGTYAARKARGDCPGCGGRPDRPGFTYCDRCIAERSEQNAERANRLAAARRRPRRKRS